MNEILEQIGLSSAEILSNLHQHVLIKDEHSRFIWTCQRSAKLVGFNSAEKMVGLNDFDIKCPAVENAEKYRQQDLKVLTTQKKESIITVDKYTTGIKLLKANYIPMTTKNSSKILLILFDSMSDENGEKYLHKFIAGDKFGNTTYQVHQEKSYSQLSNREFLVLFYLIRGSSYKNIGQNLNISSRTVEVHIENIKNKLSCNNKSEIIDRVISMGLASHIPSSFVKKAILGKISSK